MAVMTAFGVLLVACSGGSSDDGADLDEDVDEAAESDGRDESAGAGDDGAPGDEVGEVGEGDPAAFRIGPGGFENACTVLTDNEVASATGLTVTGHRPSSGCDWTVESIDPGVGEAAIGFQPMTGVQFDVQRESVVKASSDIFVEPVADIGDDAYWQGTEGFATGELWVKLDPLSFRVTNQFTAPSYDGTVDPRAAQEALGSALAEAIGSIDVIANSGEHANALLRPSAVEVPEGVSTTESLFGELEGLPVPDGAVLLEGSDLGGRASQEIWLEQSVGDTARFYLEQLPAAGYVLQDRPGSVTSADQITEYATNLFEFVDPAGRQGNLQIELGVFAPSTVRVQVFL